MAGKGGYQAPTNPSTTPSLPGSLSQRTDGGPASKQTARYISGMPNYGDGQDLMNIQQSAPLAATPATKPIPKAQITQAAQTAPSVQLPKLTDMSQRPWEPVTTPAVVSPDISGQYQTAYSLFISMASRPDASPAMKYLAERIKQAY